MCILVYMFLQESGWNATVGNKTEKYYGTIAVVTGDNLGSLAIGGFKESCTALRCCRQCMATLESAKSQVQLCCHSSSMVSLSMTLS